MIEEDNNGRSFDKCCTSAKLNPHHVKVITKNKDYEAPWTAHMGLTLQKLNIDFDNDRLMNEITKIFKK